MRRRLRRAARWLPPALLGAVLGWFGFALGPVTFVALMALAFVAGVLWGRLFWRKLFEE